MRKLLLFGALALLLLTSTAHATDFLWANQHYGETIIDSMVVADADTSTVFGLRISENLNYVRNISEFTVQTVVTAIGDSLTYVLEASLDETNWNTLDSLGNKIITANGTYSYTVLYISTWKFFRLRKISEGGTAGVKMHNRWIFGGE